MVHSSPQFRGEGVATQLEALGLNESDLRNAIIAGESDRRSRGPYDPAIVGGVVAWGAGIGNLRATLFPRGWRSTTYKGLALVVDPTDSIAITVAAGNSYTGISGPVSTKHPKGLATADLIEFRQLSLLATELHAPPILRLYFLLYHRTDTEMRAELSVPRTYRRSGEKHIEITEWEIRMVLEPVPLLLNEQPSIEIEPAVDVEVQITPRADESL